MTTALLRGDAPQVAPPPLHAQGSIRDGLRPPLTPEPLRRLTDQHHGQARGLASRGGRLLPSDHKICERVCSGSGLVTSIRSLYGFRGGQSAPIAAPI